MNLANLIFEAYVKQFNWNNFINSKDKYEYLINTLGENYLLGKGSNRVAFRVKNNLILKVAYNKRGIAQNKIEFKIAKDPDLKEWFNVPIKFDDQKYEWALFRPIKTISYDELNKISLEILGFAPLSFAIDELHSQQKILNTGIDSIIGFFKKEKIYYNHNFNQNSIEKIKKLLKIINKYGLHIYDLLSRDNIGIDINGNIKIIDYGYDNVLSQNYHNDSLWEKIIYESFIKGFNFEEFKNLSWKNQIKYARSFRNKTKFYSYGSSRFVITLDSKKVLKIAFNDKGLEQNNFEIDLLLKYENHYSILPKIYDFDKKQSGWIIVELTKPLIDDTEFAHLTKIDFYDFVEIINKIFAGEELSNFEGNQINNNEFVNEAISLMLENNLLPGDFIRLDHWAKASDGRVVNIDLGLNEINFEKYYED